MTAPVMARVLRASLGEGWSAAATLGALTCIAGVWLALDPANLHDEGLLSYGFARMAGEAPLPLIFLQKSKPVLALLYALPARLGPLAYQVAHVLVAAVGVVLLHRVAVAIGLRRPWLPALILAASPMYLWSAAAGVSNSDGVAGTVLALWLLVTRRPLLAGLVLGALPWVRFEAALFCAIIAAAALLRDRSPRLLAGLLCWPLAYGTLGALYHGDVLWFIHFPPNVPAMDTTNPEWVAEYERHDVHSLLRGLFITSPALALLVWARVRGTTSLEKTLGVFVLVYAAVFAVTHLWLLPESPLFVLGFSVRYALMPVAAGALLLGRAVEAVEGAPGGPARDPLALGALLVAAMSVYLATGEVTLLVVAGAGLLVYLGAATRRRMTGSAALAALALAGPALAARPMAVEGFGPDTTSEELTWLLEAQLAVAPAPAIYTNNHVLPTWLDRTGRLPGVRVRYLLPVDHHHELVVLTNPRVGQTAALLPHLDAAAYGALIGPDELRPDAIPGGALFALSKDRRTPQLLDPGTWDRHLDPVSGHGRLALLRKGGP